MRSSNKWKKNIFLKLKRI